MSLAVEQRLKLRHVTCFMEVVRQESVVKAARALHISQPAVTKTLQELEEIVEAPLFDRSGRALRLNAQGEIFHRFVGRSVTALKQGVDSVRRSRDVAVVTVGVLPTVSTRLLPAAVRDFSEAGPRAHVRVVTGPNEYLLDLLRVGDVDLVIGRMAEPELMRGFTFEHFYSERLVLAVRPDHPLLAASPLDLAGIANYPVLMPPPGSVIRPIVDRLLLAHGVTTIHGEVETVSEGFGRRFTRISNAIWIISEGVVAADVEDGHLCLLPTDTTDTYGPVGLTLRSDAVPSDAAEVLMACIRQVVKGIAPA